MLAPVRCFTCGFLVGDKFAEFENRTQAGDDPAKVLDEMEIKRYCCRRMVLSNVDLVDQVIPYYESLAVRREEFKSENPL